MLIPPIAPMLMAKISAALNLILIAGFVLMLVFKNAEIKNLRTDLKTVRAERDTANRNLGTCRANNTTLRTSIDSQNRSVEAMAEAGRATAEAGRTALAVTRASNKPLDIKISDVKGAKAGADNCVSADELILRSVK